MPKDKHPTHLPRLLLICLSLVSLVELTVDCHICLSLISLVELIVDCNMFESPEGFYLKKILNNFSLNLYFFSLQEKNF